MDNRRRARLEIDSKSVYLPLLTHIQLNMNRGIYFEISNENVLFDPEEIEEITIIK